MSYQWLEDELDTVATRTADPFYISEQAKADLREVHKYWKGKTTSELATAYMAPEAIRAIDHNIFTPGNYFYNGVGHVTVKYWEVLEIGYEGIMAKAQAELDKCNVGDGDYAERSRFLEAVIMSCQAVIDYADRYAKLALEMAEKCTDPQRKAELLVIASNCSKVPAKGATNFWEACQSFWFVQQLLQMESSGHSISPGRFDQYMYPYYKKDIESGAITRTAAQELHRICHNRPVVQFWNKEFVVDKRVARNTFCGEYPGGLLVVLDNLENTVAGQGILVIRVGGVFFQFFAVKPYKSLRGANPYKSFLFGINATDNRGHTAFRTDLLEIVMMSNCREYAYYQKD